MSLARRRVVPLIVAAASMLWAHAAQSQTRPAAAPDISKWKAIEFTGPVQGMRGQVLQSVNFNMEPMFIMLGPYTKSLSVKGLAEPDAVKNGMFIRFTGKVSSEGALGDKVGEAYIYSPTTPELSETTPDTDDAEVSGKVLSNDRKGKLFVQVRLGKKLSKVQVEFAEGAKIHIDVADLSLINQGDTITVSGRVNKVNNMDQANQIIAENLQIELAQPLSGKPKPRTAPTKRAPEKPADPFKQGG